MKTQTSWGWILLGLIFAIILFIFSNSLASQEESNASSEGVLTWLTSILSFLGWEEILSNQLVRKMAHFLEFASLGIVLAALFRKISITPLFFALLVALMDETIQIWTGRGPQVQDIWLDFAGAIVGFFVYLGIHRLLQRKKSDRIA